MHGDKRLLLAAGSTGAALTLALARAGPRLFHGSPLLGLTVAALALASGSLLAEALGVAAAVVELALGLAAALAGAEPGPVLDSLAQLGAVFIMYMAGLEVDAEVLSRRLAASLASGTASFTAPPSGGSPGAHTRRLHAGGGRPSQHSLLHNERSRSIRDNPQGRHS